MKLLVWNEPRRKWGWNKGPKISSMFYFFITFTTVSKAFHFCGRMSLTEGLKLYGCALWFLIPTEWLCLGWKVACTFFSLELEFRHISRAKVKCMVRDEEIGESGLSYVLTVSLRQCLTDRDCLGIITFDTFFTYKAFVELVNFFCCFLCNSLMLPIIRIYETFKKSWIILLMAS